MKISHSKKFRVTAVLTAIVAVFVILATHTVTPDKAQSAGTQNTSSYKMPKLGTDTLADPEYYPKVAVATATPTPTVTETPAATDNSGVIIMNAQAAVVTVDQPARTDTFANIEYGFSLSAATKDDLKNISFDVTKKDGTVAGRYAVTLSDDLTDRDGNPVKGAFTDEYLFQEGVSKVDFYFTGAKNFIVNPIDFTTNKPATGGLKTLSATSNDLTGNSEYKTNFIEAADLGLKIVTRAQMGIPADNLFAPGWVPPYYQVNRIVVHHTATGVNMSDPAITVRAIYWDHASPNATEYLSSDPSYRATCNQQQGHTCSDAEIATVCQARNYGHACNGRDWGDFGYNYLIDPYGTVYEGRAGGNGVRGNHAPPNEGSIGISLLGDFTNQLPTQAALDSLAKLTAYLADINQITLTLKTSFNAADPMGFYPHRALDPTSCPGNSFNAILPQVVSAAQGYLNTLSNVTSVVQQSNDMVNGKDFVKGNNMSELVVSTEGLSANLITRLSNPPTRFAKAVNFNGLLIYTVPNDQVKQFLTELRLISPSTKAQPNYVYKEQGSWVDVTPVPGPSGAPGYSTPTEWNDTLDWNLQLTKTREAWYYLSTHISPTPTPPADLHTGSADVKVAIIDTGVAYETDNYDAGGNYSTDVFNLGTYDRPALVNLLIPGTNTPNGILTEGYEHAYLKSPELSNSTFIDGYDVGQDFLCNVRQYPASWSDNPSPTPLPCNAAELEKINHANDDDGHGTFVASIIAATITDNTPNKIMGIASGIKIIPVKVSLPNNTSLIDPTNPSQSYRGAMTTALVARGIDYAVEKGANIINLSLGAPSSEDMILSESIINAYNSGVTLIAAAGNHVNLDDYEGIYYPAVLPDVIAVGASNNPGPTGTPVRAAYSNYGPELDVVAPVGDGGSYNYIASSTFNCFSDPNGCYEGSDLTSFPANGSYIFGAGTSFAVPQVVAEAAMMKSLKPALLPDQIKSLLTNSATDLGTTGWDQDTGYGLVNIYGGLELSSNAIFPAVSDISPTFGAAKGGVTVTVNGSNFENGATIKLAGISASNVQFVSSSQLTFQTPPYGTAGAVDLVVTNPDGLSATKIGIFTYLNSTENLSPSTWFRSGVNNWSTNQTKGMINGDFNGDGQSDLAFVYDYGNNDMGIWVMLSNGTSFNSPRLWYRTGVGNWSVNQTKGFISGDFNGDGFTDIGLVYDYGNNDMGVWVMPSNGSSISNPRLWYRTGAGNWNVNQTRGYLSGDFNNDGYGDIGLVYDYGNNDMGIWVMLSNGSSISNPLLWFRSGVNNWSVNQTKGYISGDFNGDGYTDLGFVYDYGNNDMGIWIMSSNGSTINNPSLWYRTGAGNWNVNQTKGFMSGDFNNDGFTDIGLAYDYGNGDMGIWVMPSNGSSITQLSLWYRSGIHNWNTTNTKFWSGGDFNNDQFSDIAAIYDYGNYDMGILVFK